MRRSTDGCPLMRFLGMSVFLMAGCAPKGDSSGSSTSDQTEAGDDTDSGNSASDDTGDGQSDDTADGTESHYLGGWPVDACNDSITSTGNEVGDIALDWTRMDQYGDDLRLHDFCDHAVLLVGSAFW